MTIGVYRITHVPSGKFYIGSSKHCERRFNEHRSNLNSKKHHCHALQNSWTKHGEESFSFEISQEFPSWDDALEAEQELLNLYVGLRHVFNSSANARMPVLDPDVMARARERSNSTPKSIAAHRAVCLKRNADPDFQRRATAAIRASEKHKAAVRRNAILLQRPEIVAKNRQSLRDSVAQKAAARRQAALLNSDPEIVARNRAATCRKVVGVSVADGHVVRFESQSAAARSFGAYSSQINQCCRGTQKTAKGYRWSYEQSNDAVRQDDVVAA